MAGLCLRGMSRPLDYEDGRAAPCVDRARTGAAVGESELAVESVHVHGPIPSEMRAVVLGGAGWGHLAVRRVRVPRPGSHQLLARVDCASICTSLLKLIEQGSEHPLMYGQDLERYPVNVTGSSGGYAWDMKKVLEMTAARQIEPSVHITHVGDLEDVPDFLQLARNREIDGKAIVYPHRRTQKAISVAEWTSSDERSYLGVTE
jgi:hypothetical protein